MKAPSSSARRKKLKASARFVVGDEVDRNLVAALEHEIQRCREAFARFSYFGGRKVLGDDSRRNTHRCHDAYADFLRHLYEFYVGCFQRDRRDLTSIDSTDLDKLFTGLMERYLARRVDAIRLGCAPVWENDASVYQVAVPEKFAEQIRRMRNAHSHVSVDRIQSTKNWSLTEFYDRCHRFVMVLFQDAHSWGHAGELGNVDSFSIAGRRQTEQP